MLKQEQEQEGDGVIMDKKKVFKRREWSKFNQDKIYWVSWTLCTTWFVFGNENWIFTICNDDEFKWFNDVIIVKQCNKTSIKIQTLTEYSLKSPSD